MGGPSPESFAGFARTGTSSAQTGWSRAPGHGPSSRPARDPLMMTKDQLAVELKRIATTQISDITRAVKEGQKSIALPGRPAPKPAGNGRRAMVRPQDQLGTRS